MSIMSGVVAAVVSAAPVATPVAVPSAKSTSPQVLFDAASADLAANRCDAAIATFTALEGRSSVTRNATVLGAVRVRKGVCLYRTNRPLDAQAALSAGLATLPTTDETYRNDRYDANVTLGLIAMDRFDLTAAMPLLVAALADASDAASRAAVNLSLARATMFDGDDRAIAFADEALRLAATVPGIDKKALAQVATWHARALLVRGRSKEALAELRKSLSAQGGLGTRVTVSDIVTRSDLALAALQVGDTDAAREYLAYTGAGRVSDAPFATARSADLPPCGGPADIRPDDSVVVEFSIADDGATRAVQPVWASRRGPMAIEFAKAVSHWSWAPADLAKIKPFFRLVTRVELRCSTRAGRPPLPMFTAVGNWVAASGAAVTSLNGSDAQDLPKLRAELKSREDARGPETDLVPVLFALANNALVDGPEQITLTDRLGRIARATKASLPVQAWLDIASASSTGWDRDSGKAVAGKLRTLLAIPAYAADPMINSSLRLNLAGLVAKNNPNEAIGLITSVADDSRLPEQDPLRIAALVQLADLKARQGDLIAARASYARTGLDDSQCALVGSAPAITGGTSGNFPMEAQRWGFEGWVRFETDVTADGRSTNQRAIVAYPPFVFREATLQLVRGLRFTKTFRPSGDSACTGYQSTVRFNLP